MAKKNATQMYSTHIEEKSYICIKMIICHTYTYKKIISVCMTLN